MSMYLPILEYPAIGIKYEYNSEIEFIHCHSMW